MNFVKVTLKDGDQVYINMDKVCMVTTTSDGMTMLYDVNGNAMCFAIKQTPEELFKQL